MDREALQRYALEVWRVKQGELVAMMIHVGDRLGLWKELAQAGPVTPQALADRTGYAARPLAEWLYGVAAAGLVQHQEGAFTLPPEGAAVLADEEGSFLFAAGAFEVPAGDRDQLEGVLELMRSGHGRAHEEMGAEMARLLERMSGPAHRHTLVQWAIEPIPGLADRLRKGATVADVGCGAGVAAETIARTFPRSRVTGIDPSATAISRAQERTRELSNLEWVVGPAEELPRRGRFDLVMFLDVLHDMPRPDRGLAAAAEALASDGVVLVKEPRTSGDFEKDRRNPLQALNYGMSLSGCLQSGLSTEDGMGLGTVGVSPPVLAELAAGAGFKVAQLETPDPAFSYFALRR